MSEFIQIERSVLEEILDRTAYLRKVITGLYERVRNKEPDDWLTLEQLCEFLNISPSKARSLKKSGRIGFVKSGKSYLYLDDDAFRLLERVEAISDEGHHS